LARLRRISVGFNTLNVLKLPAWAGNPLFFEADMWDRIEDGNWTEEQECENEIVLEELDEIEQRS
jgi:hypothetical protein